MRKLWNRAKVIGEKYMPKAVRKMWEMEEQSKNSAENTYRVVKKTDILRLKLKITDFAAAIFAVAHGWIMLAEKTIYEDQLKSNGKSLLLRIVCLFITGALVYSIIMHYKLLFEMRKLENYGVYYSSIWKDPSQRAFMIFEIAFCSIIMPPFINIA